MVKRTKTVKLYLTDEQYTELYKKAMSVDLSVTTYIYRTIVGLPIEYGRIQD